MESTNHIDCTLNENGCAEQFVTQNQTNEFKVSIKFVFIKIMIEFRIFFRFSCEKYSSFCHASIMNLTLILNCGTEIKNLQFKHNETFSSFNFIFLSFNEWNASFE